MPHKEPEEFKQHIFSSLRYNDGRLSQNYHLINNTPHTKAARQLTDNTIAQSDGRDISELVGLLEQPSTLSHTRGDSVLAANLG